MSVLESKTRELGLIFGAILTSHGLLAFIPESMPGFQMVLAGLAVTYIATNWS